jgi:hypothetical protein
VDTDRLAGCSIWRRGGWVAQSDQLSNWILFPGEGQGGLWVDDGENFAALNSADDETITFDSDNSILLVED